MVILKDYEYLNVIGKNIIKLMEQSINQNDNMQRYKHDVSNYKLPL